MQPPPSTFPLQHTFVPRYASRVVFGPRLSVMAGGPGLREAYGGHGPAGAGGECGLGGTNASDVETVE